MTFGRFSLALPAIPVLLADAAASEAVAMGADALAAVAPPASSDADVDAVFPAVAGVAFPAVIGTLLNVPVLLPGTEVAVN